MPLVRFGKHEKKGFIRYEDFSPNAYSQKIEKSVQKIIREDEAQEDTTIRLVYNFDLPVTEEFLDSLMPSTAWAREIDRGDPVDVAFPVLNQFFMNFSFGKSMRAWFDRMPGFGGNLSFKAHCIPGTPIETALSESLSGLRLVLDDKNFRIISQGVGYYHGRSELDKKRMRSSNDALMVADPMDPIYRRAFPKELYLDFKFALASEAVDGVSADIPIRQFYYGEQPLINISFNLRLQFQKKSRNPINSWSLVEERIIHEIEPFILFLKGCTTLENITLPYKIKDIPGWTKTNPFILQEYMPSRPLFMSREINVEQMNAHYSIARLPVVTKTYPALEVEKTEKVVEDEADTTSNFSSKNNLFLALAGDSSEDESSSDDDTNSQNFGAVKT